LQDPPKFTQIAIFGLKMYHLATLVRRILAETATRSRHDSGVILESGSTQLMEPTFDQEVELIEFIFYQSANSHSGRIFQLSKVPNIAPRRCRVHSGQRLRVRAEMIVGSNPRQGASCSAVVCNLLCIFVANWRGNIIDKKFSTTRRPRRLQLDLQKNVFFCPTSKIDAWPD
jgi:hypothetical protein